MGFKVTCTVTYGSKNVTYKSTYTVTFLAGSKNLVGYYLADVFYPKVTF